jgi:serine/threonine-protein kinase
VDGKQVGVLPQELTDLPAGEHTLRVEGDAYEAWEQKIQVGDEPQNIGPLTLKVKSGIIRLSAGKNSQGAKIALEGDGDPRAVPSLPVTLSGVNPSKNNTVVATRKGFETFRAAVSFADGVAAKDVEVTLEPEAAPVSVGRAPAPQAPASPPPPAAPKPVAAAAAGSGTLNINAIPAANVILDGRPLGSTPKVGVSVSSGHHTVVFVKDGERQTKTVNVASGQTQTVSHRFK